MGATLPEGSRIRIRCAGADDLVEGHVVAFVRDRLLVAHRFIARGRGSRAARYLVTSGDASVICDAPVVVDTMLGIVVACEREGAWRPVPGAAVRRGWRRLGAWLLLAGLRLTLQLDERLATFLVEVAEFGQRRKAAALGKPGRRLNEASPDALPPPGAGA